MPKSWYLPDGTKLPFPIWSGELPPGDESEEGYVTVRFFKPPQAMLDRAAKRAAEEKAAKAKLAEKSPGTEED